MNHNLQQLTASGSPARGEAGREGNTFYSAHARMAPPPAAGGIPYLRLAWGHKWLLIACIMAGTLAGTVFVLLQTPVYQATATVELVGFNQSFMGMNNVDPQAGTDTTTASASNISTQTRILTSRSLLSRVSERLNLELTPVSPAPTTFFGSLRNKIPLLQQEPVVQSREALAMAAGTLSARGVGATRLIEIQCSSTSPEVAANFVNTLAAEHQSQTMAARANVTQKTSQWMDSQLEEAKARLQQAGEKLRDFVQQSGLDFFPEQATLADSKLKSLQLDVSAIQADRIAKQSRWEVVKSTPIDSLADVIGDPTLQSLKGTITTLRSQMAQLTTTLTPENYKVQRVQAQINEAEKAFVKERDALVKRTESEYEESLRREKLLTAAYRAQTHSLSSESDKASQYAMLRREVETQQQLYNSLLQQSSQAALIAMAPTSSIRVVDPAIPNPTPSSPKPAQQIPMAGLAGGALGYGLLWLREMARSKKKDKMFDSPGHTLTVLGVPELGVIPSLPAEDEKRRILLGISVPRNGNGRNGKVQTSYVTAETSPAGFEGGKSSLLSESFRQTLVSLLRTKPKDHNPVYVITSPGPSEGKTTLCANLARAMAEVGQRVLLVDADLRRPHMHSIFGSHDHLGLTDILVNETDVKDLDLDLFVQSTLVDNLSVITHGQTQVETPALLFFSPKVGELTNKLKSRFDCVLVDTAPTLPFPDARLWGMHSDGVVLIVRAGVTTREGASAACERFVQDQIPVLGTILNDWVPSDSSALAYYQYGYGGTETSRS